MLPHCTPRLVRSDFPHLCPGDGCAVCTFVRMTGRAARTVDRVTPERTVYGRVTTSESGRFGMALTSRPDSPDTFTSRLNVTALLGRR